MNKITKHILIPAVAPIIVFLLYLTPVSVVGCFNRGLMAISVVLISLIAGIVTAIRAIRCKKYDATTSNWWFATSCILALAALLVLGPLR